MPNLRKNPKGDPVISSSRELDRYDVTVALIFDDQNLFSSSLSLSGHLCQF